MDMEIYLSELGALGSLQGPQRAAGHLALQDHMAWQVMRIP